MNGVILLVAGNLCMGLMAQSPLTFEAASIKPVRPPAGVIADGGKMMSTKGANLQTLRNTGGPGTEDPGRIHYPLISLMDVLRRAWDTPFEIKSPGWLDTQTFAVDATMPHGTTKEQFREMLRNFITDRFRLKYHIETKDVAGFSLVLSKNGPGMKESADQSEGGAPGPPGSPAGRDSDGFPVLPPRAGAWCVSLGIPGDRHRWVCQQQTMRDLARMLASPGSTVMDATGLTAKYDFTLTYSGAHPGTAPESSLAADLPEGAAPMPDIFSAVQSQLGLKLEPKRVSVEVMVVDHAEKTPARN